MPMYLATYSVELVYEGTGSYMNIEEEYEFHAEDEAEAQITAMQFMNGELFDVVMSNISVVPDLDYVEEVEEEEEDADE